MPFKCDSGFDGLLIIPFETREWLKRDIHVQPRNESVDENYSLYNCNGYRMKYIKGIYESIILSHAKHFVYSNMTNIESFHRNSGYVEH